MIFARCSTFLSLQQSKTAHAKFFHEPLKIVLQRQEQMIAVNDFQIERSNSHTKQFFLEICQTIPLQKNCIPILRIFHHIVQAD